VMNILEGFNPLVFSMTSGICSVKISQLISSAVTNEILENTAGTTRTEIQLSCGKEYHRPFTMNKTEYVKAKDQNVTTLATARRRKPASDHNIPACLGSGSFTVLETNGTARYFPATEDNLLRVLTSYGYHLSSSKELVRLHNDEYQAELDVISHVAAYFDVSSKRLIDDMPQVFESVFARGFGEELCNSLTTKLKLVGERGLESCARYVRDEPDIEARRNDLTRIRNILDKTEHTIERFFID
jgi:hypothetical protein